MRYLKPIIPLLLLLLPALSPAKNDMSEVFETWEDYVSRSNEQRNSLQKNKPASTVANSSVIGKASENSASVLRVDISPPTVKKKPESSIEEYLVHFGAGARWLIAVRVADGARDDTILSVFSFSVSPYGIAGEVGVDLALGKNSTFFIEPNLKFFFVKHEIISVYLEGDFAIYSQPSSTRFGGGASLGVVGGLIKHLSIELRASTLLLNLSGADSASLLNTNPDPTDGKKALILCPSLEMRLMARF
jgi:hypothetical protein